MKRNSLNQEDDTNALIMNATDQVIYINEEKCRNSYSCVRACPVNAIEVRPERNHPVIIADRCIGCGLCFLACSPGAIEFRNSLGAVRQLLGSGRKTAALIAPSIASEFDDITDYRKFVGLFRGLTNPYDKKPMGSFGELCAGKYAFTREDQDAWELFDLGTDRCEMKNLAAQQPDRVREMETRWKELDAEFRRLAESPPK